LNPAAPPNSAALPAAPPHFFDFTPDTLGEWFEKRGLPRFRAKQVIEWVYEKGVADPALMTNLSVRDRELLAREVRFLSATVVAHKVATDGTQKLLLQWPAPAGATPAAPASALNVLNNSAAATPHPAPRQTECVLIPSTDLEHGKPIRKTACVSSQVGCPVGCRFCASGLGGLEANLTAGQIVEQVWRLSRLNDAKGRPLGRVTNVVFMGMGEPLANFGPVTAAVRTINALWALGISARKITISTVGLPASIERLAAEFDLPVTLALSLHAPTDTIRRDLIPWAQYSTIEQLLAACQKWFDKTGREITLEYTLLGGVNDRPEHALRLAALAKTLRANINLIRYNEVAGLPFRRPDDDAVRHFQSALRDAHVNTHIRASRGRDIAAACGQLRHEHRGAPPAAAAATT
jgi:23S rRNA (adenine2503-C2)-methyltransferase